MVNVNDCGCPCEDNGKKKQIEERALSSINKVYTTEGATYYPDGTGMVTLPIPTTEQMQAIASVPEMASDIKQLKISDAEHTEAIATIESNVDTHARAIKVLQTEQTEQGQTVDALTKELPTDITLYKAGTGKIQAQVEQEDGTTLDSNVLDMAIPYQWDLISGTTSRSFRLKIHFSDGTTQETDDYVIPAGGGTDVSITDIRLETSGADKNQLKVTVDLDDGTPIGSSTISMVDSVTGSFSGGMLKVKVNGIESPGIAIDTGSLNAGTGIKIASGTISIDDAVVALKSDISDMETKTNANATFATKATVSQIQTAVGDCFNEVALGSDGKSLDFTAVDGQINSILLPKSSWVELNSTTLFSTTFAFGDEILFYFKKTEQEGSSPDFINMLYFHGYYSGWGAASSFSDSGYSGFDGGGYCVTAYSPGEDSLQYKQNLITLSLNTSESTVCIGDGSTSASGATWVSPTTLKTFTTSDISSYCKIFYKKA